MLKRLFFWSVLAAFWVPQAVLAQSLAGAWLCEYGTRNIYRTDAHAVAYQARIELYEDGYAAAQGVTGTGEPFQAEGQWSLSDENGTQYFSIRGQRSDAMFGASPFIFDSVVADSNAMMFKSQFPDGNIIASTCQRTQ